MPNRMCALLRQMREAEGGDSAFLRENVPLLYSSSFLAMTGKLGNCGCTEGL